MTLQKAERLVCRLPYVLGCRIETPPARPPVVRVRVRGGTPRQQVLLDVVTLLVTRAGLDVEEEQVEVIAVPDDDVSRDHGVIEELEHEGRIRLLAYNLRVSDEATVAEVELQHGARTALGQAESRGAGSAPELLASACLDALERLLYGRVALRLVGFEQVRIAGEPIVCILVQEAQNRSERLLVGAARAANDPGRAGAYAALDALNRRAGRVLAYPPRDYEIR